MRDVRRGVRILPLKEIDVVTFFESEYPEETVVAVATKNSRRELTRRAQAPAIGGYPTLIVTHIVKSLVEHWQESSDFQPIFNVLLPMQYLEPLFDDADSNCRQQGLKLEVHLLTIPNAIGTVDWSRRFS